MDRDGKNREVFARGIRNSVGMDFNPEERRALVHRQPGGRHGRRPVPPGELNRATGGRARTSASRGTAAARPAPTSTRTTSRPRTPSTRRSRWTPHAADLGMTFYTGKHVPAEVPRRHLLGAARLLEPDQAGRRAGDVHRAEAGRHGRQDRGLRRGLAGRRDRRVSAAARSTSRSCRTARCWCPTISPGAIYRISYGR